MCCQGLGVNVCMLVPSVDIEFAIIQVTPPSQEGGTQSFGELEVLSGRTSERTSILS